MKDKAFTGFYGNLGISTKRAISSLLLLTGLFVLFSFLAPGRFLTENNIQNFLQQIVTYAIIGCGLSFVLVGGGNDLSAGASMALSGIICVFGLVQGWPIWVCIVLSLIMGILTGIMNGFFIEVLGVIPFIATLGTQWVYRGLANALTNGAPVYTANIPNREVEDLFYQFGGGRFRGAFLHNLPFSVIIMLIYAIIMGVILAKTRIGRQIYACGSNIEAAKLSGINAVKTRMFAYCMSGFSAAICGILVASRMSSAQPMAGVGYEMEAIAAAVLGGIAISGGEGNMLNTVIGAIMMGVIRNGLNLIGVNSYWQMVIIGFILIVAIANQMRQHKRNGTVSMFTRFFKSNRVS